MLLNKFYFLFLLIISGSLLSTSFAAGRGSKLMRNLASDHVYAVQEGTPNKPLNAEEVRHIQERLLRANTRDYGRYDPTPKLSKPPFKLIPN